MPPTMLVKGQSMGCCCCCPSALLQQPALQPACCTPRQAHQLRATARRSSNSSCCCWPAPHQFCATSTAHQQLAPSRQRHVCRAAASSGPPEKASVVELLWLLKARSDVDPEQIEVLLDSLWSLQYMVPAGILCASAGPVVSCTAYQQPQASSPEQQQQQQQRPGKGQWQCGFTHAVHFRLGSRLNLERLMAHPLMSSSRDQVEALTTDHAQLVFEGMVAKRLEALFRRGEEYKSGVEHVLLLQPSSNGGLGADAFLAQLAGLAESSVAGGIQASHGAVISCVHAAATHVLMTRFAAPQQVAQLLGTPACAAVVEGDPRVPVVAVSSLAISIQPTEESTQVSGGGASGGRRL